MKRYNRVKTPFKRAYEILSRGLITEMELRQLRKNIRYSFSRDTNGLTYGERHSLLDLFIDQTLDLSREQQRKGIRWLKETHFRKDGAQRKSSKISSQHLYIIRNFIHFEFVGFTYSITGSNCINATPIYRTTAKNGMYFDYEVDPSWFGAKVDYHAVNGTPIETQLKLVRGAK